jgi:hypothetical protein
MIRPNGYKKMIHGASNHRNQRKLAFRVRVLVRRREHPVISGRLASAHPLMGEIFRGPSIQRYVRNPKRKIHVLLRVPIQAGFRRYRFSKRTIHASSARVAPRFGGRTTLLEITMCLPKHVVIHGVTPITKLIFGACGMVHGPYFERVMILQVCKLIRHRLAVPNVHFLEGVATASVRLVGWT